MTRRGKDVREQGAAAFGIRLDLKVLAVLRIQSDLVRISR